MIYVEDLKKDVELLFEKLNEVMIKLEELNCPPKTPTSKTAEIALLNYRLSRLNAEVDQKKVQISNQCCEIAKLKGKLSEIEEIILK